MTTRNACRLLVLVVSSLVVLGACTNNNGATDGTGGSGGKAGSGGGTAGSGGATAGSGGKAGSGGTAGSGGAGGKGGTSGTGGTAGMGGTVGTGGTGGDSNTQPDAAVFTCIQTSDDGLIADFTTDNGLNAVDGRQGGFYVYGDGTGTFDPPAVVCQSYPIDTTVGNPTCSGPGSFHVKATGFAKWGAALGVDFAPALGSSSGSGGTTASGGSGGAGGASGNGGSSGSGSGGNSPGGSGTGGKADAGGTSASGGNGGSGAGGKSGGGGLSTNGGNSGVDGGGGPGGSNGSGGNGQGGNGQGGNGQGGNGSGGATANGGMSGSGGSGGSSTICAQLTDAATPLKGNYDASKYKGVSFWAKSTAPLAGVQVSFPDIYTDGAADPTLVDPNASRCAYVSGSTINCSPYLVKFGDSAFPAYKNYQIDTTWKRFDIYFADTQQDQYNPPGLSVVTPNIDSAHLTAMAIQANAIYVGGSPTPNDFEIWVDDINFIQ